MKRNVEAEERISLVKALVELSRVDLLFADEYLYRAEHVLAGCFARDAYFALGRDRDELPRLTAELRQAADKGDWGRVRALAERGSNIRERLTAHARLLPLADGIYGVRTLPEKGSAGTGRLRPSRPPEDQRRFLEAPFPDGPTAGTRELGLAVELLPEDRTLNGYLSCCCAEHAKLPAEPVSEENRDASSCTCGHPCPPEVASRLRENLDLLLGHPFITSAGNRYLPWFGRETLLVEIFPESDPDARIPLLERLGMDRRHGVSRIVIEDALLSHEDLCSLGRDYESDRLTARFTILRRQRLLC